MELISSNTAVFKPHYCAKVITEPGQLNSSIPGQWCCSDFAWRRVWNAVQKVERTCRFCRCKTPWETKIVKHEDSVDSPVKPQVRWSSA